MLNNSTMNAKILVFAFPKSAESEVNELNPKRTQVRDGNLEAEFELDMDDSTVLTRITRMHSLAGYDDPHRAAAILYRSLTDT